MSNKSETPITFEELARLIGERKRYLEQKEMATAAIGKLDKDLTKETMNLNVANAAIENVEAKIREVGKGL